MCGIAGILRVHPPGTPPPSPRVAIPEEWLDILDDSIKHRGPDGQGRFRDRATRPDGTFVDVALVHRRLAIIDLADGAQPMVQGGLPLRGGSDDSPRGGTSLEGGSWLGSSDAPAAERQATQDLIAVVFNGCIYNHRALRKELQAAGHRFETDHSDTEVLVHGWREWDTGLFDRVDGMYAVVVWDHRQARMVLARDVFGEKPLCLYHIHRDGAWFNVFSSVPIEATPLPRRIGPTDVVVEPRSTYSRWLRFGFDHGSFIPGSNSVSPGWVVDYRHRNGGDFVQGESFQQGAAPPRVTGTGFLLDGAKPVLPRRDHESSPTEIEALIRRAVAHRVEADVELGCFLSGGVDSSLVAAFARQVRPDLQTFTVRMPDARYDESEFAQAAARAIGVRHHTLDCEANPAHDLISLIRQMGVPFGDSSILPAHWVSRRARMHVSACLSGDGGDELFLGYDRYLATRWMGSAVLLLGPLSPMFAWRASPRSRRIRIARLADAAAHHGYFDLLSIFPRSVLSRLVPPEQLTTAAPEWERAHARAPGYAASFDAHFYLPNDLMRKTDAASMAVALEVRSPFLDRALSQVALSSTESSLLLNGQRKGLLRAVARKYLPAEIVDRPKQGFAIPIGEWFRTDYGGMKQLLLDHLNSAEPWGPPSLGIELNMKFVRQMLDEHMGTGMSGRIKRDHSQRLYMLLVLSIWAKWVGGL